MNTILVVDDELAIVKMLSAYFRNHYDIIKAINGKTALKHIEHEEIDLIFLDWSLPDISGIDILVKMRNKNINIPVIMLTAKGTEADKLKAFERGADDYLVKPFSLKELSARVKSLLKRVGKSDIFFLKNIMLNINSKNCTIANIPIKLSNKEFKILQTFMSKPQKVFSREELISVIWNNTETSPRAVDVAINRLRNILRKNGQNTVLRTIHGIGYKFL